jgi:hypothetical protein
MRIRSLLVNLSRRGVQLRFRNGQIQAKPVYLMTDRERWAIRNNKRELIDILERDSDADQSPTEIEKNERFAIQVLEGEEESAASAAAQGWPEIPSRPAERNGFVLELACRADRIIWRYRKPASIDRSVIAASIDATQGWPGAPGQGQWVDLDSPPPTWATEGFWHHLQRCRTARYIWVGQGAPSC